MEKNIDYLFNNVPLYVKEEFKVFELKEDKYEKNDDEMSKFIKYIGTCKNKLITYCHKCKKEFPFYVETSCAKLEKNINFNYDLQISKFVNSGTMPIPPGTIDISTGTLRGLQPPYGKNILLNNIIWYIEYYCKCTNNEEHQYLMMLSIELKEGKFIVRKIGQNPSMLTVKGFDFDKYKKILERINAYEDYKKADMSNAEQFYVGAYAYLRRIFEKMIYYYIGDKKIVDDHMDKKIEAVKDEFDPRVRKLLKNLYGILSVSIHELDEEQSKEYYEYLKAIIDMQLEYMNTEEEKSKQSKELESVISKITNLVKK